ncbi:MAG TPA: hypothetical protein VM925_24415 [Labilithrix sp.]|nr:hypothetical protein [Labilithrix sp.]
MLEVSDGVEDRVVTYELPLGAPPAGGWPVAIVFQGSFLPGARSFSATKEDAFGLYHLVDTVKSLLDGGYAVIAPNARSAGTTYWQTNIAPYSLNWSGCLDDVLMNELFTAVESGTFGPLNSKRLYATGISSGGFMTSRMAVSYPGRFRALAIHSASYATCGPTCVVPAQLPADHPPTLFVHGADDNVVPVSTTVDYRDKLAAQNTPTVTLIDEAGGHAWLSTATSAVPSWFDGYP